jgi:hypothetical protein
MAKIAIVIVKNGQVECRDANGNYVRTAGSSDATDARMQGDGFTITYKNGRTELYDENGNYKRSL